MSERETEMSEEQRRVFDDLLDYLRSRGDSAVLTDEDGGMYTKPVDECTPSDIPDIMRTLRSWGDD